MKLGIKIFVFALFLGTSFANAQETIMDAYSPLIEMKTTTGTPLAPIHVVLTPDEKLFLHNFKLDIVPVWESFPEELTSVPVTEPVDIPFPGVVVDGTNIFDTAACAGHSLTEDGQVFVAGGTRFFMNPAFPYGMYVNGIEFAGLFNPLNQLWQRLPNMTGTGMMGAPGIRWYPTVTRMSDGRMLVTGGYDQVIPNFWGNASLEVFDPATGAWEVVSTHEESPKEILNPDYPHVFELENQPEGRFDFVILGAAGQAQFFDIDAPPGQKWKPSGQVRPGDIGGDLNKGSSSAFLPMRLLDGEWGYPNGTILNAGGEHHSIQERSIDVYDPYQDQWTRHIDMNSRRHHPSTVQLPDGRILILAGHDDQAGAGGTLEPEFAQYLDPATGFTIKNGTVKSPEIRGYHTLTALLPDGRVFVGGGNDDGEPGNEKPNFRYYYPDYMFDWPGRPNLLLSQETFRLNDNFWMLLDPTHPDPSEIVLLGLPSMTHSWDSNQRYIQLQLLTVTDWGGFRLAIAKAPDLAEKAPPGHYMVFAVSSERKPSIAKIIKLER